MEKARDLKNYEHLVQSVTDATTRHVYPEAVIVFGELSIRLADKVAKMNLAVYPSVEAFEAGGLPLTTLGDQLFLGEAFDQLLMENAELVTQIQATVVRLCAS